jgi:hypothetical protein
MKLLLSAITPFVMFFALSAQNLTHVDITKAKFENKNAEEVFKDIEIVPLETHKKGLLKINEATYYLTDKYIIGLNFLGPAYLFDRKTGAFIRQVSSEGRGPNEYLGWLYNRYGFDEKNNILFANIPIRGGVWKCINIETNKIESFVSRPLPEDNREYYSIQTPWFLKDNMYISFCNNDTGKDKIRLIVHDKEGTVLKKYPNYLEYDAAGNRHATVEPGIFYYYNDQTYFKETLFNDTVFCVNEKEMTPHIVFKLGDKQPSYYHRNNADRNKEKYFVTFAYESNSFILFNFSYSTDTMDTPYGSRYLKNGTFHTGYYDKRSKQVFISSLPDLKRSGGYTISGIPINFLPGTINKDNEMIAQIDPAELVVNKDEIGSKYKDIFKNIREEDNPIVIIAKLKE